MSHCCIQKLEGSVHLLGTSIQVMRLATELVHLYRDWGGSLRGRRVALDIGVSVSPFGAVLLDKPYVAPLDTQLA